MYVSQILQLHCSLSDLSTYKSDSEIYLISGKIQGPGKIWICARKHSWSSPSVDNRPGICLCDYCCMKGESWNCVYMSSNEMWEMPALGLFGFTVEKAGSAILVGWGKICVVLPLPPHPCTLALFNLSLLVFLWQMSVCRSDLPEHWCWQFCCSKSVLVPLS